MRVLCLLVAFALAVLVDIAAAVPSCGAYGYDLSSIGSTLLTWTDPVNLFRYYVQPCGAIAGFSGNGCANAMACQQWQGIYLPLGEWADGHVQWALNANYLQMASSVNGRTAYINYQCTQSPTAAIVGVQEGPEYYYNVTVSYYAAQCPQPTTPSCGAYGYDLSLINQPLTWTDPITLNTYYLQPCGTLSGYGGTGCASSMACQKWQGNYLTMGAWSTSSVGWSVNASTQTLTMTNSAAGRTVQVNYLCTNTVSQVNVVGVVEGPAYYYTWTIQYPCAGPV